MPQAGVLMVLKQTLGMVNGLPGLLGALSNLTPDGEYNFEKEYDFYEYQERNQSLYCPGGLHHGRR